VARQMSQMTPEGAAAAKQILETMRAGFEAIRPEALRLERAGLVRSLDRSCSMEVTA
jgi:hypothetical protein